MFSICVLSVLLLLGLFYAIKSPIIVRFDKKKNSCTRESKFIWEKKYRIEKLCNLKDIKSVWQWEGRRPMLYMSLKNNHVIRLFPCYASFKNYNKELYDINHFLSNKNRNPKELILKNGIHIFFGIAVIIVSLLGLLHF